MPASPGSSLRAAAAFVAGLPARTLLGLIWLYQHTLSPVLPVVFGPACGCRFSPTCSHYAVGAIRTHGALVGTLLAARRLAKCTPLHPGGLDPVPPAPPARFAQADRRRPQCQAVLPPPLERPRSAA